LGWTGRDAFGEAPPLSDHESDQTENRSKLNKLAGMDLLVTVRSTTRSSGLSLISKCFTPVHPLNVVLTGNGSERFFHHPRRISLLYQLCRMRC
jgi:hypothetical protein